LVSIEQHKTQQISAPLSGVTASDLQIPKQAASAIDHKVCSEFEGRWFKPHSEEPKFVAFYVVLDTKNN